MVKKGMGYFAGLIALYLGVYNYTGAGTLITDGANGVGVITRNLQGRS